MTAAPATQAAETVITVGAPLSVAVNEGIRQESGAGEVLPSVGLNLQGGVAIRGRRFIAGTVAEYLMGLAAPNHTFLTAYSGLNRDLVNGRVEVAAEAGGHFVSDLGDGIFSGHTPATWSEPIPMLGIHAILDTDIGERGGWNWQVGVAVRRDLTKMRLTAPAGEGLLSDAEPTDFVIGGTTIVASLSFSYAVGSKPPGKSDSQRELLPRMRPPYEAN